MNIRTPAKKILFVLLVLAWPALAFANVGDDSKEIRARYGSAEHIGSQLLFEVRFNNGQIVPARGSSDTENHFTVTVYFDGDHAGMELFTRNTSDPKKWDMSQKDIDLILANEGDGMTWQPDDSRAGKPTWVRSDKKILGRLDPGSNGKDEGAPVFIVMFNSK